MLKLLLVRYYAVLVMCLIGVFLLVPVNCEAKEAANTRCNNLHQVKNIDDLLFQFYSNIDNQCLFEMPSQQLAKIWGISVLDYIGLTTEEQSKLDKEYDRIQENEDLLFVTKKENEGVAIFNLEVTKKYKNNNKGWGGSTSQGLFPKLLPMPTIINEPYDDTDVSHLLRVPKPFISDKTVYREYSKYYWLNKSHSNQKPALLIRTGHYPIPLTMTLYSEAKLIDIKKEVKPIAQGNCQHLTKVKDIDDLIFQLYSNMDSQCLFELPTQQLEKIWGVKIFDYISISSDKKKDLEYNLGKKHQELRENGESFFLVKDDIRYGVPSFYVELTVKYVIRNKGWGGSIGQGQIPKFLSAPVVVNKYITYGLPSYSGDPPKNAVYRKHSQYYWLNKASLDNLPILFMLTLDGYLPSSITLCSRAKNFKVID